MVAIIIYLFIIISILILGIIAEIIEHKKEYIDYSDLEINENDSEKNTLIEDIDKYENILHIYYLDDSDSLK